MGMVVVVLVGRSSSCLMIKMLVCVLLLFHCWAKLALVQVIHILCLLLLLLLVRLVLGGERGL